MVVRFYILQTHYRSTLDFSNEALQASEKALKRLWEAYEVLKQLSYTAAKEGINETLNQEITSICNACEEYMNDDFNTAKVIAALFDLTSTINSFRANLIPIGSITEDCFNVLQATFKNYLETILGLQAIQASSQNGAMDKVLQVLITLRKEAKQRKDFAVSDQIRNQLMEAGVILKDEKDGTVSYTIQ